MKLNASYNPQSFYNKRAYINYKYFSEPLLQVELLLIELPVGYSNNDYETKNTYTNKRRFNYSIFLLKEIANFFLLRLLSYLEHT